MSYTVVEKDRKVVIVEKDSGLELLEYKSKSVARQVCRKLNLGSGFNGQTPRFFSLDVQAYTT